MMPNLRTALCLLSLATLAPSAFGAEKKICACKCVTKDEDDKYVNTHGKGEDREAAGIDLKKNLGKKKCELTPVCEGSC
jgi:hypothetical protein